MHTRLPVFLVQGKDGKIEVQSGDVCTRLLSKVLQGSAETSKCKKEKKKYCALAFLVAPLVTAGHGIPPHLDRTRLARDARALQRDSDTPAQEMLSLSGSPCHVSSSLFSLCALLQLMS